MDVSKAQRKVCERCGVPPTPPASKSTIGLAPAASVLLPLNALRHPPEGHSSGWFVWRGGEIPEDQDDFFKPVHIEHLEQHEPDLLPYLALPPGWRVLLAPDQEDVWYDEQTPTRVDPRSPTAVKAADWHGSRVVRRSAAAVAATRCRNGQGSQHVLRIAR